MMTPARPGTQAFLDYPFILVSQAYALIKPRMGTIQAALMHLKRSELNRIYTIFYTPAPPRALNTLPEEMIDQIMQLLEPTEAWALSNSWRDVRKQYTPATRWFALQRKCVELIRKDELNVNEKFSLKQCYRDVWLHLLDSRMGDRVLRQIAAMAEQFFKHLDRAEQKNILLYAVLLQQSSRDLRNLQPQWERLTHINFYLCTILSDFAFVFSRLTMLIGLKARAEIMNSDALLTGLSTNRDYVSIFFRFMGAGPWLGEQYNILNDAVAKRIIESATALLRTDPGLIDIRDVDESTILIRMAFHGSISTVRLLLAHGADINATNDKGKNALSIARMKGHNDVVQVLTEWRMASLEEKCLALINKINLDYGERAVLKECCGDMASIVLDAATADTERKYIAALVEKCYVHFSFEIWRAFKQELAQYTGRGLQQQWEKLASVNLHLCVTLTGAITRTKLAKYGINCDFLLACLQTDEAEAFLDSLDKDGGRPLGVHAAFSERFLSVFPALLQGDRNRIDVLDRSGESILAKAADWGNVEVMRQLLQHRPNIDIQNKDGGTPLLIASETDIMGECDLSGVVEILLEHGANIEQRSQYGATPLILACMFRESPGRIATVKILLRYGANTEHCLTDGRTALMLACENEQGTIVQLLLEHGADINATNDKGNTALMLACENEQGTIVQLLLEHGADINATNDKGETALSIARKSGNSNIVQLLQAHQQVRESLSG